MGGRCCSGPWPGASTHDRVLAGRSLRRSPLAGDALACSCIQIEECSERELSSACGSRVTSLLLVQKRSNQEKTTPRLALAGHRARQVREPGPGFSSGHRARAKRRVHPWTRPLRGLSTPTHRRTGALDRAARHPGAHSVRHRCAVARAECISPRISAIRQREDVCA